MTDRDPMGHVAPPRTRAQMLADQYTIALAVVMMVLGLRAWAVILGIMPGGGGDFDQMSIPWAAVTIHAAVVDLVASIGLWLRVAGGKVLWIYAALFEVALHTVFIGTFGENIPLVAFHLVALAIFIVLTVASHRSAANV